MFTDVLSNCIFVSKDYAETITPYKVSFTPSEVMFHPTIPDVLLIHDTEDPQRRVSGAFVLSGSVAVLNLCLILSMVGSCD